MTGQPIYADQAALAAYCGDDPVPAGIGLRQLREASAQVDRMLLTAVYLTDASGMPTQPHVITAIRDATCAQALYAKANGTPDEMQAEPSNVSLGPLSIGSRHSGGLSGGSSVPVWSRIAVDYLTAAGLVVGAVQS